MNRPALHICCSDFNRIEEALYRRIALDANVTTYIPGSGLKVQVAGTNAFLPSSLLDICTVRKPELFLGKNMQVHVVQFMPEKGIFVVGRRSVIEAQLAEERAGLLRHIKVGAQLEGIVSNLTSFGAFIDLGGIHGLLYDKHAQIEFCIGQEIEVIVKKMDSHQGGRIFLTKNRKILVS